MRVEIYKKSVPLRLLVSMMCLTCMLSISRAQEISLPYHHLSNGSDRYTAGSLASRMVDGLGFRFYWATEGLRPEDLQFKPSKDARTSRETIEHIYSMSFMIMNATTGTVNTDQPTDLSFEDLRRKTLENLKAASEKLLSSSDEDLRKYTAKFKRGDQTIERPFWNLVNGPIEDCVWHVGQVVTFRRSSGNPLPEKVNFFTGTVN